ncbi:2-amino-4-hydroxy-6-hydroxymethyldihydropteridine diphosphokinase [Alloprevotella tannerae]|uniref:2-amino-4-hydroxy-6-hydroxymethyldihydropteridine pyrophosphokinase n=1 Tax=Alloprevotella tannerae TaxID=76122 RepID=A0A929RZU8_9BACT|nr:2-amino-4-hydroxy-6-hydroxymethyldihydropteridine diphosphokinase [Alloprevotella tannerae]MBF0970882.1 2-amino-4-hydroxy-6-hydroxymethyldihydropteridine diphosphokinase [Alloprevotella tannerae]
MQLLIALGANIGSRAAALRAAIAALTAEVGLLVKCSAFYETEPEGFQSSHAFLNAVAHFETTHSAPRILQITQAIERRMGRTTKSQDGIYPDRPIDIDILALGDTICHTKDLTLPHPHIAERRFVLEPLTEILPTWRHPLTHATATEMLKRYEQNTN